MRRKPRFKPVVTRVKLNPEQAVLQCSCYGSGIVKVSDSTGTSENTCHGKDFENPACEATSSSASS